MRKYIVYHELANSQTRGLSWTHEHTLSLVDSCIHLFILPPSCGSFSHCCEHLTLINVPLFCPLLSSYLLRGRIAWED